MDLHSADINKSSPKPTSYAAQKPTVKYPYIACSEKHPLFTCPSFKAISLPENYNLLRGKKDVF